MNQATQTYWRCMNDCSTPKGLHFDLASRQRTEGSELEEEERQWDRDIARLLEVGQVEVELELELDVRLANGGWPTMFVALVVTG